MKKQGNFWVDENNNRWSSSCYSKEEAIKFSKTLMDCIDCVDCRYCINCKDCKDCIDCIDCKYCKDCANCEDCANCTYCRYCKDCTNCRDCTNCKDCINCIYCTNCTDCIDCIGCTSCIDCIDYKENPQRITSGKLGSRQESTTIYWTEKNDIQVVCGCFRGDLNEFKKAIIEKHGNNKHGKAYMQFLGNVKTYMEI